MASSRFVLPCPLSPSTAVTPASSATSASAYERKSVSQRRRTSKSGHSHRHEQIQELSAIGRTDDRGLQRIECRHHNLVAWCHFHTIEQILRVERDRELVALVLRVEFFMGLAHVLRYGDELEPIAAHDHADRGGFAGHELHAAHRFEERVA